MKKLNILLVNDFGKGGGAEVVCNWTAEVMAAHFNIVRYVAFEEFNHSSGNPLAYIFSFKHYRNIKRLIREHDIDIIHVHNYRWITPAVFLAKKICAKQKKLRLFLTAHDYSICSPYAAHGYFTKGKFVRFPAAAGTDHFFFKQVDPQGHLHSWLKKMQWYLAFSALKLQKTIDRVLVPSAFLGEVIKTHYPFLSVELLRNPIMENNQEQAPPTKIVAPQSTTLKIIYLGRVAFEKGIDKLVSELYSIRQKNPSLSFELDIYGTGNAVECIRQLIADKKMTHIRYHGFVAKDKVNALLQRYDAFIMSSIWYENAPLSIVEAAMAHLKLIIPDMGGMQELAKVCGNEYLYSIDNEQSLTAQLIACQSNSYNMAILKNNNLLNIFSQEVYIRKLERAYLS